MPTDPAGSDHAGPSGHVIVAGLSGLGLRLAEQLQASGVAVVAVDDQLTAVARRRLERSGVQVLRESPHAADVLREAGIAAALAVVISHEADLDNLETALLAAEVAPDVRLVVGVNNTQLGDQLADALSQVRVLNLAELAGPSFVEACVRSDVAHAFTMDARADAEVFAVIEEEITGRGAFRARYGDLTPISLHRAGARHAEVCPPRDIPLHPGDRLTVLGRLAEFDERGMTVSGLHDARLFAALGDGTADRGGGPRARRGTAARLREFVSTIRGELDRPFRLALAAVVTILLVSTVVLALTYTDHNRAAPPDFSPLDALYLTVETMVTVGYGDFNFGAADEWLQIFGIGLMLAGALSIAVVYAFITNVIISRRLERALGRGRAGAVRGHVILAGLGSVGVATMDGLVRAGRQVVVIERDENNRYLPVARERGVPVIIGDATVRSTLLEAGLAHATTIAALTSDGVANLETVLSAREAHGELRGAHAVREAARRAGGRSYGRARSSATQSPEGALRVVLRVFDTTMADEVERRFGIHAARSASALATPYFVGAALGYDVLSTFYVERTPFLVARMTVNAGGALVGPTLQELSTGTRVLAVTTAAAGKPDYRPGRHTRLRPGDELLVVGPVTQIVDMVRRNQRVGVPAQHRPTPTPTAVTHGDYELAADPPDAAESL
ncbi:NAD-binding protein [Frankia sp. QA3]|uniref:NAD-binding protein n=1 Tax=Frankia sp. QA3 TaxID=710111 RepID=UPI000269BD78|nr:NAD-binding protein [Frankia sp. QA3]EIV93036.1 K+ transport system, NAD-binding component [Frankia sp. QA3]